MQVKRISAKAHANLLLGLFRGLRLAMLVFPAAAQTVFTYDAAGNTTAIASGGLVTDFGFDGCYYHTNSGLHLTLCRAYDPDAGRWVNRDPIGKLGGMNLYGYVFNDPVNFTDPDGLWGVQLGGIDFGWGDPSYVFDGVDWDGFWGTWEIL